ncbi:unnamed protein product [marine sediment metagenome]|uniref:Uncharacterized protein n=1 Tax=marine sediment metagenome TaxID=412755 RepID=X1V222_9ZZZZ
MDPLQNITDQVHKLSSCARRAFLEGHVETCKAALAELTEYLNEGYKLEYEKSDKERSSSL